MIEKIKLTIDGKVYEYSKGMRFEEIAADFQKQFKYPIILARYNNRLKELNTKVYDDGTLTFLDLTSKEGNRTHINGLTYVLAYAVQKIYGPKAKIKVKHSLDKGIYIETSFKLTEEKLEEIKYTMNCIISADMPITNVTIDRLEAIDYFKENGDESKAGTMKYNTNTYVTLYRLGNNYDYFYSQMPSSTAKLKAFDLTYINEKGFVLRFPTIYEPNRIKAYQHHPHMFKVFNESREWTKIMNIENSVDLNRIVSKGKINDLIKIDETLQSNRLLEIAQQINAKKNKIKIVLLAGPSSSGKTTTSKKLCLLLRSFGLNPKVMSMDDYFKERVDNPIGEDGKPDYECLEALDLKLFDKQMGELLKGETIMTPTFDFLQGKKSFNNELKLEEDDILVMEGIHALDSRILTNIPKENKYKIYISALTQLSIDDHNRISTTDNRLLRRIIRDARTRGYPVEHTLDTWASVRRGEEKYIFPYQDEADYTINSALIYEIGVLKTYVEPLLYSVESTSPYYEDAVRLINFLRLFLPIPSDAIPQDSILREFIGNSYFE